MSQRQGTLSRRALLARGAYGAMGGLVALSLPRWARGQMISTRPATQASLVTGNSRANNVFQALKMIESQVRAGIARKKRVIVKPNLVSVDRQLAATHVECLEGVLEFLKPIFKDQIIIGDSPAGGRVTQAFENYGYHRLADRYNVRFIDFDIEPTSLRYVIDHRHQPHPVRLVDLLLDPDTYIISAAIPKTHDRAVMTCALKNIAVGAAVKDLDFAWGKRGRSDKQAIHGGPRNEGIHYNLFELAQIMHPDLAVIDGFEGMEHNGPCGGTAVDHRIAIASTDWLAADRIAVELMGFEFEKVGYLAFCARAGMGQADISKIDLLGERLDPHRRHYKPHDTIEQQYEWMTRG